MNEGAAAAEISGNTQHTVACPCCSLVGTNRKAELLGLDPNANEKRQIPFSWHPRGIQLPAI